MRRNRKQFHLPGKAGVEQPKHEMNNPKTNSSLTEITVSMRLIFECGDVKLLTPSYRLAHYLINFLESHLTPFLFPLKINQIIEH